MICVASLAGQAAQAQPCAFCDRAIILSNKQTDCVERRLGNYLQATGDPVVVSVAGCGERASDGDRLEPPPSIASRNAGSPKSARPEAKMAYVLSRADAQCLYRKLRDRSHRSGAFELDFNSC